MLVRVLLIFVLFFVALPLHAQDDCPAVDLNKNEHSPLRKIPIYDQGKNGTCYAYAASQLVDYYRIQDGKFDYGLTSPIYAAWVNKYHSNFMSGSLVNGMSVKVINDLSDYGACPNTEVSARLSVLSRETGQVKASDLVHFLEKTANASEAMSGKQWESLSAEISQQSSLSCYEVDSLKKHLTKMGFFTISSTAVLEPLFRGCERAKVSVPQAQMHLANHEDVIKRNFASSLPVVIGHCARAVVGKQTLGFLPSSTKYLHPSCGPHDALLVGQKMMGNQCQYLIRNSYGSDWKPETATACACYTQTGTYEAECKTPYPREYVGCWYPRKEVLNLTFQVTAFR